MAQAYGSRRIALSGLLLVVLIAGFAAAFFHGAQHRGTSSVPASASLAAEVAASDSATHLSPMLTASDAASRSLEQLPAWFDADEVVVRLITHSTLESAWYGLPESVTDPMWSGVNPVWLVVIKGSKLTTHDVADALGQDDPRRVPVDGMFIAWDANSGLSRMRGAVSADNPPRTMSTLLSLKDEEVSITPGNVEQWMTSE